MNKLILYALLGLPLAVVLYYGCSCCLCTILAIPLLILVVWHCLKGWRKKRQQNKERENKKIRMWNKLAGLQTPLRNIERVCIRNPLEVSQLIGEFSAVDVLEAFQAKSLVLDKSIKGGLLEILYDADVQAFMLEGETCDSKSLLALPFYFNDGVNLNGDKEHEWVSTLRDNGALPLGVVADKLPLVSSLLLNHGASFYIGTFRAANVATVVNGIAKKPTFSLVVPEVSDHDRFSVVMAPDADTICQVGRTLQNIPSTDISDSDSLAVGFVFLNQRKSTSIGKILSSDTLKVRLASIGHTLIEMHSNELVFASEKGTEAVQDAIHSLFQTRNIRAIIISSGTPVPLLKNLFLSMNVFVIPLPKELTELYVCVPEGKESDGYLLTRGLGSLV